MCPALTLGADAGWSDRPARNPMLHARYSATTDLATLLNRVEFCTMIPLSCAFCSISRTREARSLADQTDSDRTTLGEPLKSIKSVAEWARNEMTGERGRLGDVKPVSAMFTRSTALSFFPCLTRRTRKAVE
jgi:hypothetical protein